MNLIQHFAHSVYSTLGDGVYYLLGLLLIMSVVAMWRLYDKAGEAGFSCLIPVVNVFVFLKIIGRPAWHILLFFIPVYGQLYLIPKVWIELCQSFGKRTMLDYVLVILLNGLYIFNLGLSYETVYVGPAYGNDHLGSAATKPTPGLAA